MNRNFIQIFLLLAHLLFITSCGNNPYPEEKDQQEITTLYAPYLVPPKDLDPQIAYTSSDITFLNYCYEGLFSYDYLKRPLVLVPHLATEVPVVEKVLNKTTNTEQLVYHINLRQGVTFIDDRCFVDGKGREVVASDFEYAFKRLADPQTNCPVVANFNCISGLEEFGKQLLQSRIENGSLTDHQLYQKVGSLPGLKVTGKYSFDIILDHAYPQVLYWLAMPFISAISHEAVAFYDGTKSSDVSEEPMDFNTHPVGTGPYQFEWNGFNAESKMILKKNLNWWGDQTNQHVPGITRFATDPSCASDISDKSWQKSDSKRKLALVDQINLTKEKEALPLFSKFIQGYYDLTAIPKEKLDELLGAGDSLSESMKEKGMRMVKDYRLDIFYIGFNMQDQDVGSPLKFNDPALESNRKAELIKRKKLRQALSLSIDYDNYLRIFYKNSAINAQSMIPPGIMGYDVQYKNPFKTHNPTLNQAKKLLTEAGYEGGIDPKTNAPLELVYSIGKTTPIARQMGNFITDEWAKIGIKVSLELNDFNHFMDKTNSGNFQIHLSGWAADYPDPENFLFLFYSQNSKRINKFKPNSCRYENPEYDKLFELMETLEEGVRVNYRGKQYSRLEIIMKLRKILEVDCVALPLYHTVNFNIYHAWLTGAKPHPQSDSKYEYYKVDPKLRQAKRKLWNKPIIWPIYIIILAGILFVIPAILTIRKERR